ncbi:MAG: hypothetical protein ACRDCW_02705 [Sarcina sp.]
MESKKPILVLDYSKLDEFLESTKEHNSKKSLERIKKRIDKNKKI